MKIIQVSAEHTGSTVLANCLTEMFDKGNPVKYLAVAHSLIKPDLKHINVFKTHELDLDLWISKNPNEKLFFFTIDRPNHDMLLEEYKDRANVITFSYSEILETDSWSILDICTNIYNKVSTVIKDINPQSIKDMESRIIEMNKLYETIKHKPFEYHDKYFHIHGSHRNRDQ